MRNKTLKVSIITVSFNSGATISKAIESINGQSYSEIEHIVIDGGSKDKTLDIVKRLKKRPGLVLSEDDSGIYDAMNKGLNLATGDIICFLNSDDRYYSDNLIADVVRAFSNENLDLLYGDVVYESYSGKRVRYYCSKAFTEKSLRYGLMPAHPSLFVKANVYRKVGLFEAKFKIAGDFEMCCRLFGVSNLRSKYIEKPFVIMLTGGASAISASNIVTINREILTACYMNNIDTSYAILFLRYFKKLREFF